MNCICSEMPVAIYYEDFADRLMSSLAQVGTGSWIKLYRCETCGQHWSIDEYDKYVERVAIKIDDVKNWETLETEGLRKKLLLDTRGGIQEQECAWSGCKNKRVKDMAICIDHLWETGARK